MSVEISVVIPALNERERIGPVLRAFSEELLRSGASHELLVVDDGSTDGTASFVQAMGDRLANLRVIPGGTNRGKGHAVRLGMLQARGEIRVMCDADGSTPPAELGALLAPIRSRQAQLAIGSRYLPGAVIEHPQPLLRRLWSRLANRVIQVLLLPGIVDTHCGFKAFAAPAAEGIFSRCEVDGWAFDLEVLALARSQNLGIAEVPVRWADDARSRGRAVQMLRAMADFWRIRRRVRRPSS